MKQSMSPQTRSETFKKGEPLDHQMAVERIKAIFAIKGKQGLMMFDDVRLGDLAPFKEQIPDNRVFKDHNADLAIFETIVDLENYRFDDNIPKYVVRAIIEIHGDVGFYYIDPFTQKKVKANPTKHSKPLQKRNDKIVENWCEDNHVKYIILKKEEVLGDCTHKDYVKTSLNYIRKQLKEYLR